MKSRMKTLLLSTAFAAMLLPAAACDDYVVGILYPGAYDSYYGDCCYGGFYYNYDDDDDFLDDLDDFWDDIEDDWDDLFDD